MDKKIVFLLIFVMSLASSIVFSHGEVEDGSEIANIASLSLKLIYLTSLIMILVTIISIFFHKKLPNTFKKILFWLTSFLVIVTTLFLIGSTVYLNIVSPTKGPVHWHADFTIEICGKDIEIADPTGIMNRIGKSDLHEHNDNRIHIEGTPPSLESIELGEFFEAVGGNFDPISFSVPTNQGLMSVKNGDLCNNKPGRLFLFVESQSGIQRVWRIEPKSGEYIIAPYGNVPPGDRLRIIFTEHDANTMLAELQEGRHGS